MRAWGIHYLFYSLFCISLFSQPTLGPVYTIGDSHVQACSVGIPISVNGATYQDLDKSLNGKGKFTKKFETVENPNIIILALGTNDAVSFKAGRFRVVVCRVLDKLRSNCPHAQFWIWGPPDSPKLNLDGVVDNLELICHKYDIPFIM